jgi:hypothetical protein
MRALLKTLFGDAPTSAVATIVVATELMLVGSNHAAWAVFAVPALVLAGTAWLATR